MIRRARLRLTLWYAGTFVAMLLALGAATYWLVRTSLDEEVDRGVRTVVDGWLATAPSDLRTMQALDIDRHYEDRTADVFLLVFRADGALVANPSGIEAEEFIEAGVVAGALGGDPAWTTLKEHGTRMRIFAAPVTSAGRIEGVVIGGRSLDARDRQLEVLMWVLAGAGAAGLVMAGAGGYLFAGRALRPIAVAYDRQRRFVGDASHELRSPLAVIRASSELLLREQLNEGQRDAVRDIHETSVEASDLVEDLLLLARLDQAERAPRGESCEATGTARGVLAQLEPLLAQHGTTPVLTGSPVPVRCPEGDLRRVLRALVENVLAHTPSGTALDIWTGTEGDHGVIAVRDHGPGVPSAALETLLDPFARVSAARTPSERHAGLGLSIAQRLVARSGGTLTARNHPQGGLEVTVRLPRVP